MLMVALALLAGAGCTTAPVTRPVSSAEPVTPAGPPGEIGQYGDASGSAGGGAPPVGARNPAVVSLEATARQQHQSGDLEHAAASLERALRIDPDDPELWLSLAKIRLDQGRRDQAAGLARRAETLADPASDTAASARALAALAGGG
jgi:tetratricopeptide (TPR) repeat protein